MAGFSKETLQEPLPEGICSLLDTDLYKLTMQCAVLKYFPQVDVTYAFTNRTPDLKLSRAAYRWLEDQIQRLVNLSLSHDELNFLKTTCTYLSGPYLEYLSEFRFQPTKHIAVRFSIPTDTGSEEDLGDIKLDVRGPWVDTILYEIPLLALISEAYFRSCDRDWTHQKQEYNAYMKGKTLLEHGCIFSEFGTRRRRDYYTQSLVLEGLQRAAKDGARNGSTGKLSGTSNVHFAMRFGLPPVGTVAHEWFMGVAAITDAYEHASEVALRYWVATFGEGVLGIALTDTFGTPNFLKSFSSPIPELTSPLSRSTSLPSTVVSASESNRDSLSVTRLPLHAPIESGVAEKPKAPKTYAQVFEGVRQDSGDPEEFIGMMRRFYDKEGIKEMKTIVFSDSLNINLCLEYKQAAETAGFQPTFGIGTFLTNDFLHPSDGMKSVPLNIVIKLSSAAGRPAVKISDNIGKNTGDSQTVESVKRRLGYVEESWGGGDERRRWGADAKSAPADD